MNIYDIPLAILERVKELEGRAQWPVPEELKRSLSCVRQLHRPMLPPALAPWLTDVAERLQCPLDFVAVGAITVASALIGTRCVVRPMARDDWTVVPNLWGGVVGEPGSKKTPALDAAMKPLAILEQESSTEHDAEMVNYRLELAMYKATQVQLKQQIARLAGAQVKAPPPNTGTWPGGGATAQMAQLQSQMAALTPPEEPKLRRYRAYDATTEKLLELLRDNPRGLLLTRDELAGHLASIDREDHASDRAFYLEAWNGGGSFIQDRIGRGTIEAKKVCVSMLGGIQPSILDAYLAGAVSGYQNDGLMQRLQLLVYPDPVLHWRLIDRKPDQASMDRAIALIKGLADADFVSFGAVQDRTCGAPYFRFSEDAQRKFNEWLTQLEAQLKGDDPEILREHFSKYRSLLPSLALVFHLLELMAITSENGTNSDAAAARPQTNQRSGISLQATQRAIAWCRYLESHARRIYGISLDPSYSAACLVAKHLENSDLTDGFNARDIYRKNWAGLTNKELVTEAVRELVDAGWVRPIRSNGPTTLGRPRIPTYEINPVVRSGSRG